MEEFDSSKLRDKTPVLLEDKDAEIIEERNYVIENDFITLFNAFFLAQSLSCGTYGCKDIKNKV